MLVIGTFYYNITSLAACIMRTGTHVMAQLQPICSVQSMGFTMVRT